MSLSMTSLVIAAIAGCGLIGGVFFAFSSFIMKSLARLPAATGIAAMQSINVVVLNRSFLGTFMGTAAISVFVAAFWLLNWSPATSPYFVSGAVLYFVGTFLVTMLGNVPLNNRLAAISASEPGAVSVWGHYVERWTRFNTLRTVSAMAAAMAFILGLIGNTHA